MAFPDVREFPEESGPGPYGLQMGSVIAALLRLFAGKVPDLESNTCVLELASDPTRWSAGHAVFDEVRKRLLTALEAEDGTRGWQYQFEESCCQAMYNATCPLDEFDSESAFFIAGQAIDLARVVGVPVERVVAVLAPEVEAPE
ncbi:hypothetical protein [Paludisphaera soli]|uniref:hypothetical protein n=1 Tax=Paludisphaera soli TaxID=2712865 RepID=UPI0013EB22CB|nr:hypothetical protein [Paludisphaera soli]